MKRLGKIKNIGGLTLLEVLIILGVIVFFIFLNYRYYAHLELSKEVEATTGDLIQYIDAVETYLSINSARPTFQNDVKWLKDRKLLPSNYKLNSFFISGNDIEVYVTRLYSDSLVASIEIGPFKYKKNPSTIVQRVYHLLNNFFLKEKELSGISSIKVKRNTISVKIIFHHMKDPWLRVDGGNNMQNNLVFDNKSSNIANITDLVFVNRDGALISNMDNLTEDQELDISTSNYNILSKKIDFNIDGGIVLNTTIARVGNKADKVVFSNNNSINVGDIKFTGLGGQEKRKYLSDFLSRNDIKKIYNITLSQNRSSVTIPPDCDENQQSSLLVIIESYILNTYNYGWDNIHIDLPIVSDSNKRFEEKIDVNEIGKGFEVKMLKGSKGYYFKQVKLNAMLICTYNN